jgi:hypothetical protein
VPALVLGGGPPRGGKERLVPAAPGLVPGIWHRGRPSLPGRLSPTPPASTTAGHDNRLAAMPSCLSRWRSRAAITQVKSMQTATAQDIGPPWPCSAAVSRM